MKLTRILCWLLLPMIAGTIEACCHCPEGLKYQFAIDKIKLEVLDNGGQVPVITGADSICKKCYGLRVELETIKVGQQKVHKPLFLESAYANRCCTSGFTGDSRDTIQTVQVFTAIDFDSTHKAGSDVTSYFFIDGTKPLPANGVFNQPIYTFTEEPMPIDYNFILMHESEYSQCQFRVVVTVASGKQFEKTSVVTHLI
ncbi:DUF5034 domain-containing protein [Pinibacter aurantiacus]|uniref:DUF5034 domain-containing protein n=1 Tax=Pinibacter aurantiacus TaxID=2851599 RepID=A0A9E2SA95_9BACT|nr:DUF5034 domain-containing protein [Pinibacter aurantiacus]MBV4359331.1 DUF5034 domain-containing protein [Pinibacter aurantiacus]